MRTFYGNAEQWAGQSTFRVWNASTVAAEFQANIELKVVDNLGNSWEVSVGFLADEWNPTIPGTIEGSVYPSQVGQRYPSSFSGSLTSSSPTFSGVIISSRAASGAAYQAMLQRVLAHSIGWREIKGSTATGASAAFYPPAAFSFEYSDVGGGVTTDTTTLKIYRFDGVDWSSAAVASQLAGKSGSIITASGTITLGGLYAAMFDGSDSSAPVTSLWQATGSSRSFDGTIFLSTDASIVLTSTDPAVSGYASQVSTICYRVDAASADASFSIYGSSFPLALGPHVIEYRARDFAGNFEAIKTSTFLVTAGGLSRVRGDLTVGGDLLVGFLDSGARFEVESRAEDVYTLKVSSPDRSALLAVDNISGVSIGGFTSGARLTITPSAGSDAALSLRSGNSTATWSSAQLALGYDGSTLMRHAIKTQHHPSTVDGSENRVDFFLWTPAQAATALGSLDVLSLRASTVTAGASVHVRPAGTPDVELEVSDGSCTGCGTIHRAQAFTPSSRAFKEDIEYLGAEAEAAALEDLLALKPASFRYKRSDRSGGFVDDPAGAVHKGLIYEDAPAGIRGDHDTIELTELISTLELALKASIKRMDALEARVRDLKEGQP